MYFIESARFLKWFVNCTRMFVNMKIMYFILAKFVHVNVIHLNKFSVKLWKKFTDFFFIYIFQIQTYKISIKLMSICKRLTLYDNLGEYIYLCLTPTVCSSSVVWAHLIVMGRKTCTVVIISVQICEINSFNGYN